MLTGLVCWGCTAVYTRYTSIRSLKFLTVPSSTYIHTMLEPHSISSQQYIRIWKHNVYRTTRETTHHTTPVGRTIFPSRFFSTTNAERCVCLSVYGKVSTTSYHKPLFFSGRAPTPLFVKKNRLGKIVVGGVVCYLACYTVPGTVYTAPFIRNLVPFIRYRLYCTWYRYRLYGIPGTVYTVPFILYVVPYTVPGAVTGIIWYQVTVPGTV